MKEQKIPTPVAQIKNHELIEHGDVRTDPYYWLKDRQSPEVVKYLTAENKYFRETLASDEKKIDEIYLEMKSRVKESDARPPFQEGSYFYWTEVVKDQEYFVVKRRSAKGGKDQVILDVNLLAKGQKFFEVGSWLVSEDEKTLSYAVDTVGRRKYEIRFIELKNGKEAFPAIANTTGDHEWGKQSQLYFIRQNDQTLRADRLIKVDLQNKVESLEYFEKDETFSLGLSKSMTDRFLFLNSSSTLTSEVKFLDLAKELLEWKLFLARETGHEYSVDDEGKNFVVQTNWLAREFRVMRSAYHESEKKGLWQEILPTQEGVLIEAVLPLKNHLIIQQRSKGLPQFLILNEKSRTRKIIEFPDNAYDAWISINRKFENQNFRYGYQSMIQPSTIFDYDLKKGKSEVVKEFSIPNFNKENYKTTRIMIKARDGAMVPVSLLMRKDSKQDARSPLLLYGYGSYGYSQTASFSSAILSLVDRGFVYALAHIRGGEDLGRTWYENGRQLKKKNTFFDFIDCATALVELKYADPKRISAMGGSAGGLLVGAVMNLRPELWRTIIAEVPFVDVVTTMLDNSIPLTTGEYDEWGDPHKKEYYDYIKSYSPYDNVEAKNYPNLMVTTGFHDSQVQYWEPAKWVAKLRKLKTDSNLVVLRTDMGVGHGGASGRFESLKETAEVYAFLLKTNQ